MLTVAEIARREVYVHVGRCRIDRVFLQMQMQMQMQVIIRS